jgi:hypothetical protein
VNSDETPIAKEKNGRFACAISIFLFILEAVSRVSFYFQQVRGIDSSNFGVQGSNFGVQGSVFGVQG